MAKIADWGAITLKNTGIIKYYHINSFARRFLFHRLMIVGIRGFRFLARGNLKNQFSIFFANVYFADRVFCT